MTKYIRPCDSRNLNLSPLCMLNHGALPKYWLPAVVFCLNLQSWPVRWDGGTKTTCSSQRTRLGFSNVDFSPTLRRTSTTPGRRTLLLSTSFSARKLSWVKCLFSSVNHALPRIWEEHQDGPGGFHRLSWRTLWPLSRLQYHLLCWDHLLGRCQRVENHDA